MAIGDNVASDIALSVAISGALLGLMGVLRMVLTRGFSHQAMSALATLRPCAAKDSGEVQHREVRRIIDEKANVAKVFHFRAVARAYSLMGVVGCTNMAWDIAYESPPDTNGRNIALGFAQIYATFIAFIWPSAITPSNLDFHFLVLIASWTVAVSPPLQTEESLLMNLLFSNSMVAFLVGARRTMPTQRIPLLILCNISFASSASSSIAVHGCAFFTLTWAGLAFQCVLTGIVCFGAWALEVGFRAIVFRGMQLDEVKELHAAASAVLRSYCEVVLELDSEGYITTSARDLSCFLLRCPQTEGSRLVDFIASEEDRHLFTERLLESQQQKSGLADTVQVTMKDGCNNSLRLELMWFQFTRLDHTRHVMLGIREFADSPVRCDQTWPSRVALSEDPPCAPNLQTVSPCTRGAGSDSGSDGGGLVTSVCSSVPEDATVGSQGVEEALPMITVDTKASGMPIQSLTPAFCTQFGRLPLHQRYTKNSSRFMKWMQLALNDLSYGDEPAEPHCLVTLQMPSGQSIRTEVRVVAQEEGGEEELHYAGLVFSKTIPVTNSSVTGSFHGTPCRAAQDAVDLEVSTRVSL